MESRSSNAPNLLQAINYLKVVIQSRLKLHFKTEEETEESTEFIQPPAFYEDNSPFARFIDQMAFSFEEYIAFLIAMAPEVQPGFYEHILTPFVKDIQNDFLAFGGVKGKSYRGIMPTVETVLFVLSGGDLEKRSGVLSLLEKDAPLFVNNVLNIQSSEAGEPYTAARLSLSDEVIAAIIKGREYQPDFSKNFPAKRISTRMQWDDVVLSNSTKSQIDDLRIWLESNAALMQNNELGRKIKPGYRVLFYGPSGTGKTLVATLLGDEFKRTVYRIDLSQVVSKYIGETEKNLERIFNMAQNKKWILFFDEADALFGKRTNVNDAHDRYANQEVSYLLQRIEDFNGLVILASNNKQNIDDAFTRRFNAIIKFPFPQKRERVQIWKKAFPEDFSFENEQQFPALLGEYELSGGNIINVVHFACLKSVHKRTKEITMHDVVDGIKMELNKEGKAFTKLIKGIA